MYSKDMLIGILVSLARTDVLVERKDSAAIGYRVRLRMSIRGEMEFLEAIHRTLYQHEIKSSISEKESGGRPKPILRIGGNLNLYKTMNLIPPYIPDCKNSLNSFREIVDLVANKEHLQLEGFNKILELKGLI